MKPILFNTEMVRAILDGRKTVTRRLVKPRFRPDEWTFQVITEKHSGKYVRIEYLNEWEEVTRYMPEPFKPGDILYVRETWTHERGEYYYRADFESDYLSPCETLSGGYPADCAYYPGCEGCMRGPQLIGWRPSIHMPKEAARIFFRVKDVRAERLQDISADACAMEGVWPLYAGPVGGREKYYKIAFAKIWDSTIKPAGLDTYGWDANPWVWVIEFERISKEAAMEGGTPV